MYGMVVMTITYLLVFRLLSIHYLFIIFNSIIHWLASFLPSYHSFVPLFSFITTHLLLMRARTDRRLNKLVIHSESGIKDRVIMVSMILSVSSLFVVLQCWVCCGMSCRVDSLIHE
jgi:hypothetical protein